MAQSIRFALDHRCKTPMYDANDHRPDVARTRPSEAALIASAASGQMARTRPVVRPARSPRWSQLPCDSAGRYFVSFAVEKPRREHATAPLPIVAVDHGLKDFLTDSAGNTVKPYRALARHLTQMRRAHRTLSRRRRWSRAGGGHNASVIWTAARPGGRREGQLPASCVSTTG